MSKEVVLYVRTQVDGSEVSYPTGYSEEDWVKMPDEQRGEIIIDVTMMLVDVWVEMGEVDW